ncbi:hypothetical protein CGCF415_v015681 [Colletotrichum fructicola]|nr:hypothetical protein CGCF415_v015681 [Colletotrichum fructicola]
MAMMHLLGLRIAKVDASDDKETTIQKLLQDDIVKGYCIAEWKVTDGDKPPFFSMGLLFWAIPCPAELAAKVMG